jgi:uncharacterized membrane protein
MLPANRTRAARSIRRRQSNPFKEINLMNETNKTALVIAFVVAMALLLLLGGGAVTGTTMSGGMMGSGTMGGISWMWIPILLILDLGVLLAWVLSSRRRSDQETPP